jgi:large conductance mechanosensitive channel
MGFVSEFKQFASQGNLVDMAVAVVMGGAFGKVASAFVDGVVMPPVGLLLGGANFSSLKLVLQKAAPEVKDAAGAVTSEAVAEVAIQYGAFLTATIDFLVVAFAMFMVIKGINAMRKAKAEEVAATPPPPPAPTKEEQLLTEIRDLLKK